MLVPSEEERPKGQEESPDIPRKEITGQNLPHKPVRKKMKIRQRFLMSPRKHARKKIKLRLQVLRAARKMARKIKIRRLDLISPRKMLARKRKKIRRKDLRYPSTR